MHVTDQHWDALSKDFTDILDAMFEEWRLAAAHATLEGDQKQINRAGTISAEAQVDEIKKKLLAGIDDAEREVLAKSLASGPLQRLFETFTEGARIREAGGTPLPKAFESREFRQAETKDLIEFAALRVKVCAAIEVQRQRIAKGELCPLEISAKHKTAELARLERQIAEVKTKLDAAAGVLAMFRDGKKDHLADMINEYAQAQDRCSFPIDPLHRIKTHPAYGNITNESHPDAASIRLPEKHLKAWHALREFLAAKAG